MSPSGRKYSHILSKKLLVCLFIIVNLSFLILRSVSSNTRLIDPTYFALQLALLIHLFLQVSKENDLGLKSPWYTFGLFYISNICYFLLCGLSLAFIGRTCETYSCNGEKNTESCYTCRDLPMMAYESVEETSDGLEGFKAGFALESALWGYVVGIIFMSIAGLILERKSQAVKREKLVDSNSSKDQDERLSI
ncbi:hypothetical protein SteCoe_26034 [Stentor coeruleus]|uniref:Uncharacterized protein n=1 Tax=Stentor coeruleus TaxID=5963 RepID=A0A1R2BDU6_9CILI|nr:hypothetical protein SteCoe_26034 [Stentor coeruleus]